MPPELWLCWVLRYHVDLVRRTDPPTVCRHGQAELWLLLAFAACAVYKPQCMAFGYRGITDSCMS